VERYLEDLLEKKIWLREITIPYGGDIEQTELVRKKLSVKELITNHPVWRGYSTEEARRIIAISINTWTPIYRKYASNQNLLEKRREEYGHLITVMNAREIIQAWKENTDVKRDRLLQCLNETLAFYARTEDYAATLNMPRKPFLTGE